MEQEQRQITIEDCARALGKKDLLLQDALEQNAALARANQALAQRLAELEKLLEPAQDADAPVLLPQLESVK